MQKLGTIVSKRAIKDVVGFVEVVKDMESVNDSTKPILVIGLEEAKKQGKEFSILNKRLDSNLFWTFGKTERRTDHERDIQNFYEYVLNKSIKNIKYYYINIFKLRYNKVKKLLDIIYNTNKKYIYINNDIIYIYYNNYILGISLTMTDYMGVDRKKIIRKLRQNKYNIVYYHNTFLDEKMKEIANKKQYILPYFMSLQEDL